MRPAARLDALDGYTQPNRVTVNDTNSELTRNQLRLLADSFATILRQQSSSPPKAGFLAEVCVLEALSSKDVAELLAGAGAFLAGATQAARFLREILRKQRARKVDRHQGPVSDR